MCDKKENKPLSHLKGGNRSLPSGWRETTLGEVAEILSGGTPSTKNKEYWGKDISWITPKDLSNHNKRFIGFGEKSITALGLEKSSAKLLKKNTILFSSRAPIGYVAIAENEVTTNQGFKNIHCDEVNTHFLFMYYWLKRNVENIEKLSSGSTFSEVSASIMRSIYINLPPLPEQKAIADVLSSLDEKIELLQEENKILEELAQTIFKEWFVNFNFPGATGEMEPSELGEIPNGWRVGKLGEEFQITMGQSPKGSSYNEEGIGTVFYQGRAEFQERFPKRRLYTTEPKRMAERLDVLMSVRAPVGDINVASEKCCIGRGLASIRSSETSYKLYKLKSLKSSLDNYEAEGTVFGSINKNSLEGLVVIIPNRNVVLQFEEKVKDIDQKIYVNTEQIYFLKDTRDTILPKLMSGEIRVKGFGE